MKRRSFMQHSVLGLASLAAARAQSQPKASRPNILWIVAEDASPHIGCYGETAITTPNLDALAAEGVRFENAFVTCPVCSPARSAMVTGMYQTTLGAHNHRSQNTGNKAGGNTAYYKSYELPEDTPLIGDYFREAGYYVCNGSGPAAQKSGKTDYNFINTTAPYDGADWRAAPEGKPFFAQLQLSGGKWRQGTIESDSFQLPPYYPNDAVMRKDWNAYLASWERVDREVGEIVTQLRETGVYDNTLIVFITDHGISHARGKQFLYDEGIRIPMVVRFPDGRLAGTVRDDLVLHIDLAPLSMAVAGLPTPAHLQGRDLFAADYNKRDYVVSARDRCDETIDVIRSVRTPRYKYIRNFLSHRPHLQRSQYKDGKEIVQHLRLLHEKEALTPLQDTLFRPSRPPEELYDLAVDPYEISNLASDPEHESILREQRSRLHAWMIETRDPGLIPEPILEDLGRDYGSKHAAMQDPAMAARLPRIIATIEAGEANDRHHLNTALTDGDPVLRYWAATWLGHHRAVESRDALEGVTTDPDPTVRLSAHLALCTLGDTAANVPKLAALLEEPNDLVGLYAMNAIEQTGVLNEVVKDAAQRAIETSYDGTQRYGTRLLAKCDAIGV